MALIVEDGSNVAGANSYVSLAEAQNYANARLYSDLEEDAQAEANLIKAMDYLESIASFRGVKTYTSQALLWPRTGATIDDLVVSPSSIPAILKKAQIEIALAIARGIEFFPATGKAILSEPQVKKDKTGPMETEYFELSGNPYELLSVPYVSALLDRMRGNELSLNVVRV